MRYLKHRILIALAVCLALLIFAPRSRAADVAYINNQGGTRIVFTDTPCKDGKSLIAHSADRGGKVLFGCWFIAGDDLMVVWDDGDVYRYPIANLTPGPALEQRRARPTQGSI